MLEGNVFFISGFQCVYPMCARIIIHICRTLSQMDEKIILFYIIHCTSCIARNTYYWYLIKYAMWRGIWEWWLPLSRWWMLLIITYTNAYHGDAVKYTSTNYFTNHHWLGFTYCLFNSLKTIPADIDIHWCDVIMGNMASQITSLIIVYSIVYSGADPKMFPFDDVIMYMVVGVISEICLK